MGILPWGVKYLFHGEAPRVKDFFEDYREQKDELEWNNRFCQTELRARNLGRPALEERWRAAHLENLK
jgi:hypothetical protein